MRQNGVEINNPYKGSGNGVEFNLPDGTRVGQRFAGDSTGKPVIDANVPGRGYMKIHINPRGGVPEISAATPRPAVEAPPFPPPVNRPRCHPRARRVDFSAAVCFWMTCYPISLNRRGPKRCQ